MALRAKKLFAWSFAACIPLAVTARADVIESTPADPYANPVVERAVIPQATDVVVPEAKPVDGEFKSLPTEVIHERYPNRAVKIERHVIQDSSGNYVNHGRWTMYDEQGHTVAYGDYRYGERHGVWTRWHTPTGKDMFSQLPYKSFQAPFVSEVMFDNGRIHGLWTVYDSKDRKCSEFTFEHDEREGKSTWYNPNGEKMREIDFTAGQLDGHWMEWGASKSVTKNESYQNGRGLAKKVEMHKGSKVKKSEGTYLLARQVLKTTYDWWNGTITTTSSVEGKDQRHGAFASWHPNGQKNEEGHYQNDLPVGKFTWWYANGQLSSEGVFDGGDRDGAWTWWHENGQKSVSGEFVKGVEIGKWTWWNEDGKVANSARITQGQSKTIVEQITPPVEPTIVAKPTPKASAGKSPARTSRKAPPAPTRR